MKCFYSKPGPQLAGGGDFFLSGENNWGRGLSWDLAPCKRAPHKHLESRGLGPQDFGFRVGVMNFSGSKHVCYCRAPVQELAQPANTFTQNPSTAQAPTGISDSTATMTSIHGPCIIKSRRKSERDERASSDLATAGIPSVDYVSALAAVTKWATRESEDKPGFQDLAP